VSAAPLMAALESRVQTWRHRESNVTLCARINASAMKREEKADSPRERFRPCDRAALASTSPTWPQCARRSAERLLGSFFDVNTGVFTLQAAQEKQRVDAALSSTAASASTPCSPSRNRARIYTS
jgi:hypothetical protein